MTRLALLLLLALLCTTAPVGCGSTVLTEDDSAAVKQALADALAEGEALRGDLASAIEINETLQDRIAAYRRVVAIIIARLERARAHGEEARRLQQQRDRIEREAQP